MSERPTINFDDLPPDVRKALRANGVRKPRQKTGLTKDEVRGQAIRVLNVIAHLTPNDRTRVLAFANQLNEV